MGRQLLTVLDAEPDAIESAQVPLADERLKALYEALLLTRLLDATCVRMQGQDELGFYVPALPGAAVSAGAAIVLHENDWLFPSFRDTAAYLLRGGTVDTFLSQVVGTADEPLKGRQLPGQGSLAAGGYVAVSGLPGAQVQQAAGVGLAARLRGDRAVALALFGPAAVEQGAFHTGIAAAERHRAQTVFVCRSTGSERPAVADLAAGAGMTVELVDGSDCLAVAKAVHGARERAVDGGGPTLIEAVVHGGAASDGPDPAGRLRAFVEHRGIWDPEHEEEFIGRCQERIRLALESIEPAAPASATLIEDVWSAPPWTLREQAERLGLRPSRESEDE